MRKGIAKDNSYIALELKCKNGVDTYVKRFKIAEEHSTFLGYGYCVRTPDFEITINNRRFVCFWADITIGIPHDKEHGEYDGLCFEDNERKWVVKKK